MHLTECFAPLIAYVVHFQRTAHDNLHSVEQVRSEIDLLLRRGEEEAERGGVPEESYDAARFAVCAWADEAILNSQWPQRGGWLKEQLQRHYYGTSDAGEEFFERLKDLPLNGQGVREVYFLCLSLGFTGRYCTAGGEEALCKLRSAELKVLSGTTAPDLEGGDFFPGGYPQDLRAARKDTGGFSLASLPVLSFAGPVLFFLLLLVVFRFALGGVAENLLKSLPF